MNIAALSDEELIRLAMNKADATPLEQEMTRRFAHALDVLDHTAEVLMSGMGIVLDYSDDEDDDTEDLVDLLNAAVGGNA